jgi:hypothetical protein
MRASSAVKRQLTRVAVWFRVSAQVVISVWRVSMSGSRRLARRDHSGNEGEPTSDVRDLGGGQQLLTSVA